jgi:HSP20 family molecular chaperone IbpA
MKNKILSLLILVVTPVTLLAIVDMEEEIYAPAAEMKMLDDAMNRGIEEQRQRNARRPMLIEDTSTFTDKPMLEFVDKGDEYVLEKSVEDINNTTITTKVENKMLTVTEVQKIEEVVIEDSVKLGSSSSTKTEFFESRSSETLSLPHDADEKTVVSRYENGLLKVVVQKK